MPQDAGIPQLDDVLLFLVLAGILIPLLQRFRIGNVLGFLVVGAIVGPLGLGQLTDEMPLLRWLTFGVTPAVRLLGEIGIMFLMFAIGLELSTARLWSMRRWVFGAGILQVVLTVSAVVWLLGRQGQPPDMALVVGIVVAFSSTAVVMQLLAARHELGTAVGRAVFSVLLLQDLAVVPALIIVGTLGRSSSEADAATLTTAVALALLKAVIAILFIYVLGRRVIRPLFRSFAASRQADTFMALTLLASLGIATLTWLAGLSMALGAFLAGLLLAETEYRHEVEVAIEPFRGLLMGLFFMTVGMGIDPAAVLHGPLRLPLIVVGMMLVKFVVASVVLRVCGLSSGRSVEGGLLLSPGGEFAFVVTGSATALGLLSREFGAFLMLVIGLSLFLAPAAAWLGRSLAARIDTFRLLALFGRFATVRASGADAESKEEVDSSGGAAGHVILAGYGRVGRLLSDLLDTQGIAWVAVDDDPATAARHHAQGLPVFVGDAARVEMLRRLGAQSAQMVVLTMDKPQAALRALATMRQQWPSVPVYARARDDAHARELSRAGAVEVIPEALESALQLGARLLDASGLPEDVVGRIVDVERTRRMMDIQDSGMSAIDDATDQGSPQPTPPRDA